MELSELQKYIHKSRYARFRDDLGRREEWEETVDRYFQFFTDRLPNPEEFSSMLGEARQAVLDMEVMPSMRAMMTAGKALDRDHVAGYNCSYMAVDSPRVFDEACYILMCGVGVGFSVERQYIAKLPEVAEEFEDTDTTIVVKDSKRGWAKAYKELIGLLYQGRVPKWDMSKIRPAGERLKTFGGRASGPQPLIDLFNFTVDTFKGAAGRKLNSMECHDIMCKIGDIVVCGGVRRSALISLSNLTDKRMQEAKTGQWWIDNPQRALANNSVAYTEKPDAQTFLDEWYNLVASKSGERGIFNRVAAHKQVPERRKEILQNQELGSNPCNEILLRSKQFCNLSEIVVRSEDDEDSLKRKARIAAFLGTLQATLTDFSYLSKEWKKNTEEEALLGVSMTGIMDNPLTYSQFMLPSMLDEVKEAAVEENEKWAKKLGINPAAAVSCIKPSGTVSQLVDSASGIHPRYSRHYLRAVRADKKDPLAQMMIDQGFPYEEDFYKPGYNYVFYFPVKSPDSSVVRNEFNALDQLNLWETYQDYWCEHKPSMTTYVTDEEWMSVGAWVYERFDKMSGISFLPHTEHSYQQAPYQELTEDQYNEWVDHMPEGVDWSKLAAYEETDNTIASQEMACSAGGCDVP